MKLLGLLLTFVAACAPFDDSADLAPPDEAELEWVDDDDATEQLDDDDATEGLDDDDTTEEIVDDDDVTEEPTPDPEPEPPDLETVTWLHSDISGWPVTSTLGEVTVGGGQICLPYDAADDWPIHDLDGTDVVGNPWIFIWQDEQWYGATWEWLRPSQTCKAEAAVAGDHIKRAPFDAASGWTPTSGTTYWFMVSGLARFSERNVEERTNLVPFVWP